MKFKPNKPWIVHILKYKFPQIMLDTTILVWGDTIYTPHKLTQALLSHEQVHIDQQGNKLSGTLWWFKYTFSVKFRLKQEIEAFRAQYKADSSKESLYNIARNLSSELYNNIISFDEVVRQISGLQRKTKDSREL